MKRILESHHREVLRDLLLGYIQHCEISRHLIGTVEKTLEYDGIKYAVPGFTFYGPPSSSGDTNFIGIIGGRRAGDRVSAEVTLQLIERLVLQPGLAEGLWLRVLPVLNPVGIERNQTKAPADTETEEALRLRCNDGVIEIASTDRPWPLVGLHGDAQWTRAAKAAVEDINRLHGEAGGAPNRQTQVSRLPDWAHVGWNLYIEIPKSWDTSLATHYASQYLLAFFRRWQAEKEPFPAFDEAGVGSSRRYAHQIA
jgi:hypothetical protein